MRPAQFSCGLCRVSAQPHRNFAAKTTNDMTQKTELTTERLIIRTPSESDVNDVYRLMADAETALSTGFRPMTDPSEAEGKIRRGMADGLMFAIAEKANPQRVAGVFEVAPHTTATAAGERLNYGICYFLDREARGKGYMTEVVGRMKRIPLRRARRRLAHHIRAAAQRRLAPRGAEERVRIRTD